MAAVYHFSQPSLFPSKECTSCHIEKSLDEFYKSPPSRGTTNTHQSWCKVCWNERRKQKRLDTSLRIIPDSKVCTKCEIKKSIDEFYTANDADDLHKSACKECCDKASGYKKIGKVRSRRNQPVTPGYKWCYGCKQEQLLSKFRPDKTKRDGLHPRCDDCHAAIRHARWEANKEELKQKHKEWYAKPENRLKVLAHNRKRSAHISTPDPVDYAFILERDDMWCYICDQPILPNQTIEFDHVIPLQPPKSSNREPGQHHEDNIKVTHKACNRRKHNRLLEEMTPFQRRGIV